MVHTRRFWTSVRGGMLNEMARLMKKDLGDAYGNTLDFKFALIRIEWLDLLWSLDTSSSAHATRCG